MAGKTHGRHKIEISFNRENPLSNNSSARDFFILLLLVSIQLLQDPEFYRRQSLS